VALYEAATHKLALPTLEQPGNPVKLVFSPDDRVLVSVTDAGSVNFYELPAGTRRVGISPHAGVVWMAFFNADGRYLLTASSDHTARLWETATAKSVREFRHEKAVFHAAFSHDGSRVLTCSADHTARLWETETGRPIGEPMRHPGDVWYGEFGSDDRFLLTGDDAGNARIWDAATGLPLSGWVHNGRSLKRAHLRPDGRQALSAAVDGTVRVWPVVIAPTPAPAWLVPLAEAVAGRRLTAEGTTERVSAERLRVLRAELGSSVGDSFYSRWARWFLTERVQENPAPFRP
jgi:WD40 repeat protein